MCTRAMPIGDSPYCSSTQLAALRDAAGAYELALTDAMLLWTPAEAKDFFASGGAALPDAKAIAMRTPADRLSTTEATQAAASRRREALLCIFCPCCDQWILAAHGCCARRRAPADPAAPAPEGMARDGNGPG